MAAPLTRPVNFEDEPEVVADVVSGTSRRRFLGYALAAPTLITAASVLGGAAPAGATIIPSPPEPADLFDLSDVLNLAAAPTAHNITIEVTDAGGATFAMPRTEVGQGLTTSVAMIIAEEMDLPLGKVEVTLADARPELMFNQLTGGSNSIHSLWGPVRAAAAAARQRLVEAAATKWNVSASRLRTEDGVVHAADGRSAGYGELTRLAAADATTTVTGTLKDPADYRLIGQPHNRVDALAAVTGDEDVRDGPQDPWRAADDGVPPADDQRDGPSGCAT